MVRRGTSSVIFTLTQLHYISLSEPAPAGTVASPLTRIYVDGVPVDIPANTELKFIEQGSDGCIGYRLTTDGVTLAGSSRINIQPYIGRLIPCHWVASCGPIDLTGRTYKSQVKKKATDPIPYITLQCSTVPLEGKLRIKCTTTGTEDLNAKSQDLPRTDEELQLIDTKKDGALIYPHYKKIIDAAWYWDLEYIQGTSTEPDYEGLFWLYAEATVGP